MANLKDLLVKGPSNLIGDVTVNKIRLTSLEVNNGTNYDPGSNGQVLKSNGTSVYWANDNNTITANATDGLWDLTGTDGTNSVTYALAPYSSKQTTASFYTGTIAPSLSTRLNYDGYLYAKKLYSDGAETITKNGGTINNSLTLQKSSTSPDSPELIFNGQAGNSDAYKWSIQKNSSGDLIFSKTSSNNTSTTTIVFSADGYLLPNITNTYDLGSNNNKWANVYATNFKGNADTATTLSSTLSINKGGTNNTSFTNNSLIYYKDNQLKSIPDVLYQNNGILKIGNDDSVGSDMVEVYGNMFIDGLITPPLYTERNYDEDVKYDLGYSGGYEWDNVYANNFIGNLTGNADTATSLSTSGTTTQFWRGDNTWSNVLKINSDNVLWTQENAKNLKLGTGLKTLHIATGTNGNDGNAIYQGISAGLTFGIEDKAYAGIYYQSSGSYGSRLYFATTSSFGNGAYARMVIRQDGKIGIGVLAPNSLLHIKNGDLEVENGQLIIKGTSSSPASSTFNSSQLILYDSGSDVVGLELQRQHDGSGINSWQIINDNNTLKFKIGENSYDTEIITATSARVTIKKPLTINNVSTAGTNSTPIYWNNGTPTAISSPIGVSLGGTGNSAFSANTLIYTSNAATLSSGNGLYTTGSNLAINKTSITNGFSFEVNGNSKFTGSLIPSATLSFDLGDEDYWWDNIYAEYFAGLSEATNKLITYVGRDVNIPTTANYGGAGAVFHIIGKSGENGNGSPVDMNILQMNWDNNEGYDSQLGIANGETPQFLFRSQISNNNTNWRQAASIVQGTKTGSATKPVYVNSSGEVKTIDVTINSGTTNNFTYYSSNKTLSSTNAIQYNSTYGVIMEKAKIKTLTPYYLCTDCLNTNTWFYNPSWHVLFNMTASNKPTEAGLYLTTLSVKYQKALILGGNFSYTNCNIYWGGVLPITPAEGSPYDNLFYQLTNSIDSQGSNNVQLGYYFHYSDNSTYYGTVFNINFTNADSDCQYKILEAKLTLQKITSLLI